MLEFENQGTNTYLVYKISADDNLDTMSLGMLTNSWFSFDTVYPDGCK